MKPTPLMNVRRFMTPSRMKYSGTPATTPLVSSFISSLSFVFFVRRFGGAFHGVSPAPRQGCTTRCSPCSCRPALLRPSMEGSIRSAEATRTTRQRGVPWIGENASISWRFYRVGEATQNCADKRSVPIKSAANCGYSGCERILPLHACRTAEGDAAFSLARTLREGSKITGGESMEAVSLFVQPNPALSRAVESLVERRAPFRTKPCA